MMVQVNDGCPSLKKLNGINTAEAETEKRAWDPAAI